MQSGQVTDTAAGGQLPEDDIVYQITTFGADYTVDGLILRFDRGDIYRPEFQRAFVWTVPQASKFIESILLGLPIPSVFLYREEESRQHLIVDGLQRLTTLHAFHKGIFPTNEKAFRLKGVKPRFENKTLDELTAEDRRRFEDAVIHAMIIQQASPENDKSSVFHIFERLNSNGTPLEPQEIRAAIYHGKFQSLLYDLNHDAVWREIFGPIHKRSKDEELILRFLAFYFDEKGYVSPMKLFLNNFMGKNRSLQIVGKKQAIDLFTTTLYPIYEALGDRAFRLTKSLNAAIFDSFMVAVARNDVSEKKTVKKAYDRLMASEEYLESVAKATANPRNVETRMRLADQAVRASL